MLRPSYPGRAGAMEHHRDGRPASEAVDLATDFPPLSVRGLVAWVIVGGESGPGWRPMEMNWVHSIRDQCAAAGVAYFGKQRSGVRSGLPLPAPYDRREWPEVGR